MNKQNIPTDYYEDLSDIQSKKHLTNICNKFTTTIRLQRHIEFSFSLLGIVTYVHWRKFTCIERLKVERNNLSVRGVGIHFVWMQNESDFLLFAGVYIQTKIWIAIN